MPPKPPVTLIDADPSQMSKGEQLKSRSEGLFFIAPPGRDADTHAFGDELDAMTRGAAETIGNEAKELSKFFGIYREQRDDLALSESRFLLTLRRVTPTR